MEPKSCKLGERSDDDIDDNQETDSTVSPAKAAASDSDSDVEDNMMTQPKRQHEKSEIVLEPVPSGPGSMNKFIAWWIKSKKTIATASPFAHLVFKMDY